MKSLMYRYPSQLNESVVPYLYSVVNYYNHPSMDKRSAQQYVDKLMTQGMSRAQAVKHLHDTIPATRGIL